MLAGFVEGTEAFHIHLALVLLHTDTGMQGDVMQGGIVEHIEYGFPFVGILPSQTHLDRELKMVLRTDTFGQGFDDVYMCQQTGAAPMLGLHGKRTAHIEVYPGISFLFDHAEQVIELLHGLQDDLRHYGYTFVVFGTDIAQVLATYTTSFHTQEGSGIGSDTAYQFVMQAAVYIIGIALQGGEVDVH